MCIRDRLDTVKREAIAKNPALGIMLAMDSLERIAQKHGVKLGEDEDGSEGSRGGYLTFLAKY